MGGHDPLLEELIRLKGEGLDLFLRHYFEQEVFSLTWWVVVALFVLPLIFWWKLADKKRLLEICVFGLLINVAASFLDVFGSDYVLWEYPVHVLPMNGLLFPVDYVIVPVVGMLLYQRFAKWKPFLIACTLASAFMSFACEPFAVWIGMYKLISWKYVYSFPIYIALYAIARLITQMLASRQAKAQK
ncbi:MAG: hypothetical protein GX592_05200 [Clostridiales bacterium]|nr:hypothetical protein [Clostridiales bacterium]